MASKVGQAYIGITADGKNINKEIADMFDGDAVDKMGRKHGKAYQEAFAKQLKGMDAEIEKSMKSMGRAIETDKHLNKAIDDKLTHAFNPKNQKQDVYRGFRALFEHIGEESGAGWGKGFDPVIEKEVKKSFRKVLRDAKGAVREEDKLDLSDLFTTKGGIDLPGREIEAVIRRVAKIADDAAKDAEKKREVAQAKERRDLEDLYRAKTNIIKDFTEASLRMEERKRLSQEASDQQLLREQRRILDTITREHQNSLKEREDGERRNADITNKFLVARQKLHERSNDAIARSDYRLAQRQQALYDKLERAAEKKRKSKAGDGDVDLVGRYSKMFGKGSRGDPLHYFGASVGVVLLGVVGIAKAMAGLGRIAGKVASAFASGFEAAADSGGKLTQVAAGFGAVGAKAAEQMALLATSGPAALAALAIGAAVFTAALGVVVVMLSVVATALSALAAMITALTATIVVGLSGAVAVLGGLLLTAAAAGGALTLAFKSLNDEQKKALKESMIPFRDSMKEIGRTMATEMAPSFKTWGDNLKASTSLFKPWASAMGRAFGDAGSILTKSLTGPGFQKLSTALGVYLPGIVRKMSTAMGGALNGLGGVFAALMPTVDRFASYLEKVGTRFSEWANSTKGQNSIKKFAEEASEAFISLWGAVREFGGFLKDVLFNPATLAAGNGMFDSMRDSFEGFRESLKNGNLEEWLRNGMVFGSALKDVIASLAVAFRALSDSGTLDVMASAMRGLAAAIEWVSTALPYAIRSFDEFLNMIPLAGPLLGAMADGLGKLMGSSDRSEGALTDWNAAADAAASKAAAAERDILGLAGAYDILGGSASEANRRMAYQKLGEQEGVFSAASKVGVGRGDLVSAALGDPKAIKRVKDALAEVDMTNLDVAYSANLVATAMGLTKDQFSKVRHEAIEAALATGKWKEQFPGIPEKVLTKMEVDGVPKGRAELRDLLSTLDLTAKERKAVFKLMGIPQAKRDAKGVKSDIEKIPSPKIRVDANTEPAKTKGRGAVSTIDKMKAKFDVGANTQPATTKSKSASSAIGRFAPIMNVGAKTADAISKSSTARSAIDKMKSLINVSASTTSALSAAYSAASLINGISATIKVGTSMVGAGISALKNKVMGKADGGTVDYYANGGLRENHVAQIARKGTVRVWNEDETEGEAYIPLALSKRRRSLAIWQETGRRLGATVASYADGAVTGKKADKQANKAAKQAAALRQLVRQVTKAVKVLANAESGQDAVQSINSLVALLKPRAKKNAAVRKQITELKAQKETDPKRVDRLLKGLKAQNATMADYAKARGVVAKRLEKANEAFQNAVAMKNDFYRSMVDGARSFASLVSAQGEVIDGVEQDLKHTDITKNLRTRLDAIRKFQSDLNVLRSLGLGNEAYKQLIEAGVEQGGAFADALVKGGVGAVDEVNSLLSQIGSVTDAFGKQASTRLYQAGIDTARGVVEGLKSMDAELAAAGTKIGDAILQGVRKALGLKGGTPSKNSGKKGGKKVTDVYTPKGGGVHRGGSPASSISASLSARVPVSSGGGMGMRSGPVSGNQDSGRLARDIIIQTPTKDPKAVAAEVLNEMVGRF